jgi:hypothetical protein
MVLDQLWQKVCKTPSQWKKAGHSGMPVISVRAGHMQSRSAWAKIKTLSPKKAEQRGLESWLKRQSACLAKHKVLSSNPSTAKKKKKIHDLNYYAIPLNC